MKSTRTDQLIYRKTKEYMSNIHSRSSESTSNISTERQVLTASSSPRRKPVTREERLSKINLALFKTQSKPVIAKSPKLTVENKSRINAHFTLNCLSPKPPKASPLPYFAESARPTTPQLVPMESTGSTKKRGVKTTGRTSQLGERSNSKWTRFRSDVFELCKSLTCSDVSNNYRNEKMVVSRKSIQERGCLSRAQAKRSNNTSVDSRGKSRLLSVGSDPLEPFSPVKASQAKAKFHQSNVKVVGRVRPLSAFEKQLVDNGVGTYCCTVEKNKSIVFPAENFTVTLDHVFDPSSSQNTVYNTIGKATIEDVLNGYNGTILAYGQTGSGKTFTMFGPDIYDEDLKGIVPRAAADIFKNWEGKANVNEAEISCSMLEIYKENLKDLLADNTIELKIKESPDKGIYVEGLTIVPITSQEELMYHISVGGERRAWAETRQNAVSSRSHTIFMLEVKQFLAGGTEKRGLLNLVDLAGSEKVGKSGAQGQLFQEGTKINLSLSALGNVIHALTAGLDHIPYRDSKLTRLLQESLGGNYKTTLIVTCSPHSSALTESISALKFAQRAKKLKNKVQMNVRNSPAQLLKTIEHLKDMLKVKEAEIRRMSVLQLETSPVKKKQKRSRSVQRFGMKLYISGSSDESSKNQIVVNVGRSAEGEGDIETEKLRGKLAESNACVEGLKRDNTELRIKLKAAELATIEEKKRLVLAEVRIAELEGRVSEYEYWKEVSKIRKESENTKSKVLSHQNKALIEALEDAEAECLKLLKEKKEKLSNDFVEFSGLSLSDYFYKNTLQSSFSDKWTADLREIGLETAGTFIAPRKLFNATTQLGLEEKSLRRTSKYADTLGSAVVEGKLSHETMNYLLRNQLIDAAIINHNLKRVVSLLTWKLMVETTNSAIKGDTARVLQKTVDSLESLLDNASKKYQTTRKKLEKVGYELDLAKDCLTSHKEVFNVPTIQPKLRKPIKNPGRLRQAFDFHENAETYRKVSCTDLRSIVHGMNKETDSSKVIEDEVDSTWQKTLANLLMGELANAREQVNIYKSQVAEIKKSSEQLIQDEDRTWQQVTTSLKENYDNELARKQEEISQLHDLLAQWIVKYMDLQKIKGTDEGPVADIMKLTMDKSEKLKGIVGRRTENKGK